MTSDSMNDAMWMGQRISEIPREQLEKLLVGSWTELDALRTEHHEALVRHVEEIRDMSKRFHEARKPLFYKLLDRIFS